MERNLFWQAFLDTGAPEMYLLFRKTRKLEDCDVPDYKGTGPSGNQL